MCASVQIRILMFGFIVYSLFEFLWYFVSKSVNDPASGYMVCRETYYVSCRVRDCLASHHLRWRFAAPRQVNLPVHALLCILDGLLQGAQGVRAALQA